MAHQRNRGSIRKPRMTWNVPGANSTTLHKQHQLRPPCAPRNGLSGVGGSRQHDSVAIGRLAKEPLGIYAATQKVRQACKLLFFNNSRIINAYHR